MTARVRHEENAAAVDQYGAGAALPLVTALLRAGQVEMVAQHIEQRRARVKSEA